MLLKRRFFISKLCLLLALPLPFPLAGLASPTDTNLSLGRPCKAFSSLEADGWSLARLTDGETIAPGWSSKSFSSYSDHTLYPEFVVVDLGTNSYLREVILHPRSDQGMVGKGFPQDFTIEVCREGEPWRKVVTRRDYPAPDDGSARSFSLEHAEGRFLKIEASRLREVEPGRYFFQLAEISVLGEPAPPSSRKILQASTNGLTTVGRLRCENRDNPGGIDVARPRLSWWMLSDVRKQKQTAYRIVVSSDESLLRTDQGDLWDSRKMTGDRSVGVLYEGKPLQSGQVCWWKVKLWDKNGNETAWSEPAQFQMGMLNPEDWRGLWIGADSLISPDPASLREEIGASIHVTSNPGNRPVYLRKEIEVARPVKRAMVYFSGLGFSELFIDGQKVGDYVVGPGFTNYDKRTPYLAFDVTRSFSETGRKAMGVILVDGWYGNGYGHSFEKNIYVDKPKLLLNLHLEYTDGTESIIVSDGSWKWACGEITLSGIVREDVDKRKALIGWDRAGYDESGWSTVKVVDGPDGRLVHQKEPPARIIEEIHPVSMKYDQETNTTTFDFGREFNGWVRFRTSGAAGTEISITSIPTVDLPRTSHFILAGTGSDEIYEPRFFYAGMRKVVVKGTVRPPIPGDITGCLVSIGWLPSGSFRCSDDVANWLNDATRRTVEAYTTFLPNDPVREWKAWTQDIQSMFWSTAYLFDSQTMYERWHADIVETQREDGSSPNVTPGAYFDGYNSPWWGGCLVWLPWQWYLYYGDNSLLIESYTAMKRYVDYLGRASAIPGEYSGNITEDGMQDWGLADWCPVEETPRVLLNTPAYCLYAEIVSRTARMLGHRGDGRYYAGVARSVRSAFNRRFFDPVTGIYGVSGAAVQNGHPIQPVGNIIPHEIWWSGDRTCTQAGQVLPLALGMVPEKYRSMAEKALLKEIAAHGNRLSTGFVSTPYMLQVLSDLAPETGWTLTSAQDYPSWYGMTVGSDQDLLKETWAGGQALMPSLGGNLVGWQTRSLAGIRPDPSGPGFRKFFIKPNIVGDLHWVEDFYDSVHGRIISNWRKFDAQLVMEITIPANTTATVYIPAGDPATVRESGHPVAESPGVKFLRLENGASVYSVAAGSYCFSFTEVGNQ